jgi:excinuclease ABC subunit A
MEKRNVDHIEIRGARVHNLKNVDLDIPLRKLICFAGPSGSGKTSLAFHTLLTESKRRFVNSFPNSMKFFTDRPAAVDVDSIFPVLPVFGLPQINPVMGSRTAVCDVMRLTDSLQNLYFTAAKELCPVHDIELHIRDVGVQLRDQVKALVPNGVYHILLTPNEFIRVFGEGYIPPRSYSLKRKTIEAFQEEGEDYWEVMRFKFENLDSLEKKWQELKLSQYPLNYMLVGPDFKKPQLLKFHFEKVCPKCDFESKPAQTVSAFSPYSALGACPNCNGYGANLVYDDKKIIDKELTIQEGGLKLLNYGPFQDAYESLLKILKKNKIPTDTPIKKLPKDFFELLDEGQGAYPGYADLKKYLESKKYKPSVRIYIRHMQKEEPCKVCMSTRLNKNVHHYRISLGGRLWGLQEIMSLTVEDALQLFSLKKLNTETHEARLYRDICEKLKLATEMGLNHLSLLRRAKSLSAGEYQRLLLIKYLTFKGVDSLFVLDEPSLGLGETELKKLIEGLRQIIDQGNTVILIDHSEYVQKNADHLFVMGPGSGKLGGEILYQGPPKKYFTTKENVVWDTKKPRNKSPSFIEVSSPSIYGKNYPDFKVPLEEMVWVTGDSGSGKSANLIKIMANTLYKKLYSEWLEEDEFTVKSVKNPNKFDDVMVISSDLNRFTSRSSVGTITEFSSVIRKHFLKLPVAKSMNLKEGHLSANSELGMCPRCEGKGSLIIEMQYLEDIVLECEDCKGLKIKPLYANISDGKMTVAEAYNLPLNQVLERIELTPKFRRIWEYLKILNLDYLSLDRGLNTLSGGEKQRVYLLSKLMKTIQNSLLIFENLSFGLSEKELKMLGTFLQDLLQLKNTIVIIDSSTCFQHLASSKLEFKAEQIKLLKLD